MLGGARLLFISAPVAAKRRCHYCSAAKNVAIGFARNMKISSL
jgi:hypothetical protein